MTDSLHGPRWPDGFATGDVSRAMPGPAFGDIFGTLGVVLDSSTPSVLGDITGTAAGSDLLGFLGADNPATMLGSVLGDITGTPSAVLGSSTADVSGPMLGSLLGSIIRY